MKNTKRERQCKRCGCTDDHACEGGCFWVTDNLCSKCYDKKQMTGSKDKMIRSRDIENK